MLVALVYLQQMARLSLLNINSYLLIASFARLSFLILYIKWRLLRVILDLCVMRLLIIFLNLQQLALNQQ